MTTTAATATTTHRTLTQTTLDTPPRQICRSARRRWIDRLCLSIAAGGILALGICALPFNGQPANTHLPTHNVHIAHANKQTTTQHPYTIKVTRGDAPSSSLDVPTYGGRAPAGQVQMAPLSAADYPSMARQAAARAGISPYYFVRQIQAESGFNPRAVSGVGAIGIAQFMPATAASMGVNPYDPASALNGAARWMASLNSQFGGNYAKALAAYNAGPGAVQSAVRAGGANWLAFMPAETQNYVHEIMG